MEKLEVIFLVQQPRKSKKLAEQIAWAGQLGHQFFWDTVTAMIRVCRSKFSTLLGFTLPEEASVTTSTRVLLPHVERHSVYLNKCLSLVMEANPKRLSHDIRTSMIALANEYIMSEFATRYCPCVASASPPLRSLASLQQLVRTCKEQVDELLQKLTPVATEPKPDDDGFS